MPYRGGTQQWSNRFNFTGAVPSSGADWLGLMNLYEPFARYLLPTNQTLVEMVGYLAGSDVPVYTHSYGVAGLYTVPGSSHPCPGDCCAVSKFTTDARTSKNHPIYLFKYLHVATYDGTAPDTLSVDQHTQVPAGLACWLDGSLTVAGTPVSYCGPYGAVALAQIIEPYISHRDFPR